MLSLFATTGILVALVEFARALPWPQGWLAQKPLSCVTCMVSWAALGFAVVDGFFLRSFVSPHTIIAAAGFAFILVSWRRNLESSTWAPPS